MNANNYTMLADAGAAIANSGTVGAFITRDANGTRRALHTMELSSFDSGIYTVLTQGSPDGSTWITLDTKGFAAAGTYAVETPVLPHMRHRLSAVGGTAASIDSWMLL